MISIRREMENDERCETRFRAVLKTLLGLCELMPRLASPANPKLGVECEESLQEVAKPLKETPTTGAIAAASEVILRRTEEIRASNQIAIEERDTAMKSVVGLAATAIQGFRGSGERHGSNLEKLADRFEILSGINDPAELRRRLVADTNRLRLAVTAMCEEQEKAAREFEAEVEQFQQRLEGARKDTGVDRLTGLGNRREAEKALRAIGSRPRPTCVLLFDIVDFRKINVDHGALFGDHLLQTLARLLRTNFDPQGSLFRWSGDEFLAIAAGRLDACQILGRQIQSVYGRSEFFAVRGGIKVKLKADLNFGVIECESNESPDQLYRRARAALDQRFEVVW